MTHDTFKKIQRAIADCDRYIAKESPRNADTRPESVSKTLAHYIVHRAKLTAMLATAEIKAA